MVELAVTMARTKISQAERTKLRREIRIGMEQDKSVPLLTRKVANEVAAYWRDVAWPKSLGVPPAQFGLPHHYETGRYRESIKVERQRKRFGMPRYAVVTNDPNANFIEYGTGPDKPGSRSPWGPYTPTPEFAPAGKTALHFGGTAP